MSALRVGAVASRAALLTAPHVLAPLLATSTPPAILDASWYLPAAKRDAAAEFRAARIPTAAFWDLDAISDRASPLPHMLPPAHEFGAAMAALGVTRARRVVVYDTAGGFGAAARAFWTLRAFGHEAVTMLDGGFAAWRAAGLPVDERAPAAPRAAPADAGWALRPALVRDARAVAAAGARAAAPAAGGAARRARELVVDARPRARFAGAAPEPRAVPPGHMPGSRSVFAGDLLDAAGAVRPVAELRAAFAAGGVDVDRAAPLVLSCGSGVNACTLYAALLLCGRADGRDAVYDGSWAEWAGPHGGEVLRGDACKASSDFDDA